MLCVTSTDSFGKKHIPPKVSFMLWAYFHDSLPTRSMLQNRRVEVHNVNCVFCNTVEETADHMLLHCEFAFKVWSKFMEAFGVDWCLPCQ